MQDPKQSTFDFLDYLGLLITERLRFDSDSTDTLLVLKDAVNRAKGQVNDGC